MSIVPKNSPKLQLKVLGEITFLISTRISHLSKEVVLVVGFHAVVPLLSASELASVSHHCELNCLMEFGDKDLRIYFCAVWESSYFTLYFFVKRFLIIFSI